VAGPTRKNGGAFSKKNHGHPESRPERMGKGERRVAPIPKGRGGNKRNGAEKSRKVIPPANGARRGETLKQDGRGKKSAKRSLHQEEKSRCGAARPDKKEKGNARAIKS